jgi:hypothetical protein
MFRTTALDDNCQTTVFHEIQIQCQLYIYEFFLVLYSWSDCRLQKKTLCMLQQAQWRHAGVNACCSWRQPRCKPTTPLCWHTKVSSYTHIYDIRCTSTSRLKKSGDSDDELSTSNSVMTWYVVLKRDNTSMNHSGIVVRRVGTAEGHRKFSCRARSKCDGTRAETRFRLSPKRTSPFKSAGASVQSTAGSRGVRISGSNAGYTTILGNVRVLATHSIRQFPLHFPYRASPCAIRFQPDSTSPVPPVHRHHHEINIEASNIVQGNNSKNNNNKRKCKFDHTQSLRQKIGIESKILTWHISAIWSEMPLLYWLPLIFQ